MALETETNIDDLTDKNVLDLMAELTGATIGAADLAREMLRRLVSKFDRASPDWPQRVLGLPPVERLVHG